MAPMRRTRFVPLVLAALLLTAAGQTSTGGPEAVASAPRAGEYRTTLELILFEVPGVSEDQLPQVRESFVEELGSGNTFCLTPDPANLVMRRKMLEHIAEGDCTFDRFEATGATVSAAMSCARSDATGGRVTMDGRIWAENADVNMALAQELPGRSPTRIVVRARAARVGDCPATGNP